MMNSRANPYLTENLNVSELVLDNPRILLLLEHFNIHVPFQEMTIREICKENMLNPGLFLMLANLYYDNSYHSTIQFSFADIPSILRFLKNSHVYYTEEMYPGIRIIIKQMNELNNRKEMELVEKFFNDYFNEVTEHLNYEDEIAFPYMKSLHEHIFNRQPLDKLVSYSVHEYKDHHNDIEEKLNDLKNLLIKYLPGKNDQKLRRHLFNNLTELEYDLNIHGKVEDRILIPLVEEMELNVKGLR
jgi:regulator of cell morphogenesis and NO signaling